ncbi:MAG TPA: nucleotide exchange factor GrpE [Pirellulaceae bacterium]|nr:nucleotide exchange factor GrpE [Pirellulaceae bacterium]
MTEQQEKTKREAAGNGNAHAPPEAALVAGEAAERKIADLEAQLREETQRALRAQAELENYRKRVQREVSDERRYAALPLVRDLLPAIDNLQRAIDATPTRSVSEDASKSTVESNAVLLEGVKMVVAQLETVLKQHHCQPIEAAGQPFDPNQHEAIAQEPSSEYPAGTVTRAVQAGYKLHDRVVRPAQVFVSTGPEK